MNSRLNDLVDAQSQGESFDYLFFWGHRQKGSIGNSCLSQWFPVRFEQGGDQYFSAEQFMMAGKAKLFGDYAALEKIFATKDPDKAKGIGRKVKNFDHERWAAERYDIVVQGNILKFSQNEALKGFLLGTGSKVLVEASPLDQIWGIGLNQDDPRASDPSQWCGQNLLGFALMDVREELRE